MSRKKIERKIFLEELPKKKDISFNNKTRGINWEKSIGYKVRFIYDDIEGDVEIIEYILEYQFLIIKYNHIEFKISINGFKTCSFGNLLNKHTSDFKIEIGVRFKDEKRDITIIDREYRKDKNNTKWKYYKYHCNKDGYEGWIIENNLIKRNQGCSCCSGLTVVEGINDIPTTNPEMVKYFVGGYDEAKLYTKTGVGNPNNKGGYIHPICPDCGKIKNKKTRIRDIYTYNSMFCSCSDKISFPNKCLYNILHQLKEMYHISCLEFEYSSSWTLSKRFDSYFILNNKEYIIEMDGGWHNNNNKMSGQTKEESKAIDNYKDELARQHDIKVIRIDCDYGNNTAIRFEHIKNNIFKSSLNNLFDLNKLYWDKVEDFAMDNLIKTICEFKRKNPNYSTLELSKIFGLSQRTIISYLKIGNKNHWCKYNPNDDGRRKKLVQIFKNGISLGIFDSVTKLEKESLRLFGIKLLNSNISQACKNTNKEYKGFTFRYLTSEEIKEFKLSQQQNLNKAI